IRRRLRLTEWDRFMLLRSKSGDRPIDDHITFGRHDHLLFWDDEAVAFAAAPFAGGIAVAATGNPAVVRGGRIGKGKNKNSKDEREPCKASEHGYIPFVVPGAAFVQVNATLLGPSLHSAGCGS